MTELDLTDGKIFLNKVTEKIRTRLAEVDASIEAGQKDIQSMNEYYWENYTEMDEYGYENYDNQFVGGHDFHVGAGFLLKP
mgnify:CR=1 FL=1